MAKSPTHESGPSQSSSSSSNRSSLVSTPVSRPPFGPAAKSPRSAFHSRLPSRDKSDLPTKARLVEQFYKMDPNQALRSHGNLTSVFWSPLDANAPSALSGNAVSPESVEEALHKGQLVHQPLESEVPNVEDVLESLLSIENQVAGDFAQYMELMENATHLLTRLARELERGLAHRKAELSADSMRQIARLGSYLRLLQQSVSKVQLDLTNTTVHLKEQYSDEMKVSMSKLETLELTLSMLNARLETARHAISTNKAVLTGLMGEKLDTLEYISARFSEYDQLKRQQRVGQLITALVVVVVMVCALTIMRHGL